jgi:hypothetical protein
MITCDPSVIADDLESLCEPIQDLMSKIEGLDRSLFWLKPSNEKEEQEAR